MRPDPGRDIQERIIGRLSTAERTERVARLRERGIWMAWHQVDAAGIIDPVEQADFLLRRLYPEMPEPWFRDVLAKFAALHAAGEWRGFQRP